MSEWLIKVGFHECCKEFEENEITGDVLLDLGLAGLRELGIESLSKRIDLYRKIMILKEELSSPIEDTNSDYAVDIYNDYRDSNHSQVLNLGEDDNMHSNVSSEMESPRTLVTSTVDSVDLDDFHQRHQLLKLDVEEDVYEEEIIQEEEIKDDETLKGESNSREGLLETIEEKWSQLTREYEDNFNLDKSAQESIIDMEGWIYIKTDHRGWKKRFAVLVEEHFSIYKDEKKQNFLISITLSEYKVLPSSDHRQYSFQLIHSESQSLYLATASQALMLNWINRLVKAGIGMHIALNILERRKPMLLVPIKQVKYKPLPSIPHISMDANMI